MKNLSDLFDSIAVLYHDDPEGVEFIVKRLRASRMHKLRVDQIKQKDNKNDAN